MIDRLIWWRFLWRQKRGKAAAAIWKGRAWIISDVVEAEKKRRADLSDMWPEQKRP